MLAEFVTKHFSWAATLVSVCMFAGILLLLNLGRRLGARRRTDTAEGVSSRGAGVIEGAVFALLGLLVAFTFSGAAARFDARRHLIVEEANTIGTAYLRVDLLPADAQPAMRDLFRRYVDTRIETYRKLPDVRAALNELEASTRLQREIWQRAVAGTGAPGTPISAANLLLPAVNAMFDIANTRVLSTQMHPPFVVFGLLLGLALVSAFFAGIGLSTTAGRHRIYTFGFALTMAGAVHVILDLEYPRLGALRLDEFDRALIDVRATMD
jgi:hypothetical protein